MAEVDPGRRFAELMAGPDAALPLDEVALLIAAHVRPGLDHGAELARLDRLAAGVRAPTLDTLRHHLFVELGFTGNRGDYYDPDNSCIDQVVRRRLGIPITLSVVMMEVGRRLGVPMAGVSMPGHFLVRDKVDPDVFIDPFDGGAVLDVRACEQRFHDVHGSDARFDTRFLEPVSRRAIVARILANLDAIATARSDRPMLEWVTRLRASMPGAGEEHQRRLASVLAASYRFDEAADILERLATTGPGGDAADDLTAARRLRARLN